MWTLKITDGDLTVNSMNMPDTLENSEKLSQELTEWCMESLGVDPLHPTYGSTLQSLIGQSEDTVDTGGREALQTAISTMMSMQSSEYDQHPEYYSGNELLINYSILPPYSHMNATLTFPVLCTLMSGDTIVLNPTEQTN